MSTLTHASTSSGLALVLDLLHERIARYRISDFTLVYCNGGYARTLDATPQDLIGRRLTDILTADEQEGLRRQVARLGAQTPFLRDSVTEGVGGRWIEWSDLFLPGEDGDHHVLAVGRDVTERREAELRLAASEERFRGMAMHDELTGLANRRLLRELLSRAQVRAERDQTTVIVSYIDLNDFKQINDTLGHHAGDLVLQSVAARLRSCMRQSDFVARVGGDEFVVVAESRTNEVQLQEDRLHSVMSASVDVGGVQVDCSASIGSVVALLGQDAAEVIRSADALMYRAKRAPFPGPVPVVDLRSTESGRRFPG